ncbi:MAG: deoxyribose-phosphate aldolase [Bdellovibrionales bacterium]
MANLSRYIDHTLLVADAQPKDIKRLCEEAKEFSFYSVCVNPTYVHYAKQLLQQTDVKVCTVVDFPLGASGINNKATQAEYCCRDGADEIDMVIPVGLLKAGRNDEVRDHIQAVAKKVKKHGKILKVIVETGFLNHADKIVACKILNTCEVDFIKTSTGFGPSGAKVEDIKLFKAELNDQIKIKASGGIKTAQQARELIEAGADRLGTSASVAIVSGS